MNDREAMPHVVPSEAERKKARKALEDCEQVGRPLTADEARIIGWTLRCLESEWGSADESLILAGYEDTDLDPSLWMHPDYKPLYPRINQMNVERVSVDE